MQKEVQSTIETVGHQGAWMLFRYKTDPKKQRCYKEDNCLGLDYGNLQEQDFTKAHRSLTRSVRLNPSMARHSGKNVT